MHLELDTETNGFKHSRLASISWALVHEEVIIGEFYAMVKPNGWKMDPEATEKNGLTDEALEAFGIPLITVLNVLEDALRNLMPLVVAHQVRYDLDRVLVPEFERIAHPLAARFSTFQRFCTMDSMARHCGLKDKRGNPKKPNLAEAYKHATGRDLVDAHTATADRRACGEIYRWLSTPSWTTDFPATPVLTHTTPDNARSPQPAQ